MAKINPAEGLGKIAVVGGVNMDIGAVSFAPLLPGDSNPGRCRVTLGGVGRNIAHNLCLLGHRVTLLTALGEDIFLPRIEESCRQLGMDLSHARRVPGGTNSAYVYICGPDGDMAAAVSDMEICRHITPDYLEENRQALEEAELVVFDANLEPETIAWLAEHCTRPLFADPVSAAKCRRILPALGRIHTLKSNRLETERLTGIEIRGEEQLRQAAEHLLSAGVERVFITLGAEGGLAASRQEMVRFSCAPAKVRNTTGAGDAFLAALASAWQRRYSLSESLAMASAAAAQVSESEETIAPELSPEGIRSRTPGAVLWNA